MPLPAPSRLPSPLRLLWVQVCLGLALALLPLATRAQNPGPPDGPDRRRIEGYGEAYVAALNSGSEEARLKAIRAIYSSASLAEPGEARISAQMARLLEDMGRLEYHHSDLVAFERGASTSYVLHAYVRQKGGKMWNDLQFRVEPNPPHKINALVFIASVSEPVTLPNGPITDARTLEWLNGYIDTLVARDDLAGSLLLVVGERVLCERAFGYADAARTTKATPDTRFNLGSGDKMFTAVAVAQLAENGLLAFSDPIAKYFPDFPDAAFAQKATVAHLLSHTSGVGEYWTDEYERHSGEIRELRQMLPWVHAAGIDFQPGASFKYSNSNFILAGLIVEKVSGTDYYDYVRQHITGPLGMASTGSYPSDGSVAGLARPLVRDKEGWRLAPLRYRGTSAGGGYSTPRDILAFSRGLLSGKLVKPETFGLLTTAKNKGLQAPFDYGYGFILDEESAGASFGHGGTARGINFAFRTFPETGITFVLFCNQDNGAFDDLRRNTIKLITGKR
jgi:CubicO group peptidase (beta-lactamase class C family)